MPKGLIGHMIKVIKIEGKYTIEEIRPLLEETREVPYKNNNEKIS